MMPKKPSSIRTTIAFAFAALVSVMVLAIAVLSYTFTQEAVEETAREYTGQLISQVQTSIDSYITHMQNIAQVVQVNEQVQEFFGRPEAYPPDTRELYRDRIGSFLNSISRTRKDISLILIIGAQDRVITHAPELELNSSVNIEQQGWYRAARESSGHAVVSSSHVQNIIEGDYRWVITLSRTINDPETGQEKGVLLVDLNFSVINDLVNSISLGKKGYLFIVDPEGRIVYHPRQELIYSDLEREYIDRVLAESGGSFMVSDQKGSRIYTISTSDETGWRTVGVNYAAELVQNRGTIQRYYLYWGLICIAVAIAVAVLISHTLSRPITRLRTSMQAVEQGDFDVSADVSARNEIGELAKDFNIMVSQIKDLMRRNAEEQEQKRRSELMALQNQITPHFLYNTLDSVVWMAEGKNYTNVVKTISALARLLRLSISRGDELISVRDEIEHIKSYLTIQKLRYRDKLDFSIEVEESVFELKTPKVILQPLVENAIYHGIKNKVGTGTVRVSGERTERSVMLRVIDDGVGMSEERRQHVLAELGETSASSRPGQNGNGTHPASTAPSAAPGPTAPSADAGRSRTFTATGPSAVARRGSSAGVAESKGHSRTRVGVRNVHERIQLYFGRAYGLGFAHNEEGGTVVTVTLPIVTGEEDTEDA
jgi:two-component system sensor histidine kinase YesM